MGVKGNGPIEGIGMGVGKVGNGVIGRGTGIGGNGLGGSCDGAVPAKHMKITATHTNTISADATNFFMLKPSCPYAACGILSEMIRDTPGRSIVTP
jgi:hypothetical protein